MKRTSLIAGLAALSLAACTAPVLDRVAGAEVDEGGFGAPTMRNMLAMADPATALTHLGGRFASAVPATITFAFDDDALDARAMAALDAQANFMRQFPELRFSVYGHADEVGSAAYNEALGLHRARAAVRYLASRGVSTARLAALVSYGESRPAVPAAGAERANRRTVTTVSGYASASPMVLDGKYAQLAYRRYVTRFTTPANATPPSAAGGSGAPPG